MKVHVFTQDIKIGSNSVGVGFRVVAEALPMVEISLSRVEGACLTPIHALWEHDGHSPTFIVPSKREVYVDRVIDDIYTQLDEHTISPWYKTEYQCITTKNGVTWETHELLNINPSLKINAPPTKFHGKAESNEDGVKEQGTIDSGWNVHDAPIYDEEGEV